MRDAQDAFETLVAKGRYAPTAAAVKAFLTRYREAAASAAAAVAVEETPVVSQPAASTREPRRSDVDWALEEFAITIGPKLPVSRSKATASADVVEATPPVPTAPAEAVAPAEAARTLVIASAIEGHAAPARPEVAATPTSGLPQAEAPRPRRKSDRLSESPQARERVGDAARRARQSTLRGDIVRPALHAEGASAGGPAADAPRKTRGRLDALRALEEELSRLAALDLVMPRHQVAAASVVAAEVSPAAAEPTPAVAAEEASPAAQAVAEPVAPILAAAAEAASAAPAPIADVHATSVAAAPVEAAAPVVAVEVATAPAVVETASVAAPPPVELPVVARAERRPFLTNAIDAELAELMGEPDADECATPIWTIADGEAVAARALETEASVAEPATPAVLSETVVEAVAFVETSAVETASIAASVEQDAVAVASVDAVDAAFSEAAFVEMSAVEVAFVEAAPVATGSVEADSHGSAAPVAHEPEAATVASASEPVFELRPPTATPPRALVESFELTAPAAETREIERPMLLELSAFEQAADDIYAAAAQMRQSARLFDAEPPVAEPAIVETAIVEAASAESAIAETAIVEVAIVEPAIVETAIVETARVEIAIAETAIVEAAPAEVAIVETAIAETAIVERAIAETAIAQAVIADWRSQNLRSSSLQSSNLRSSNPRSSKRRSSKRRLWKLRSQKLRPPRRRSSSSAIAEPTIAETGIAEFAIAEPAIAESATAEIAIAESAIAESAIAESAIEDSAVVEPVIAEPLVAESAPVEAAQAEPAPAEAGVRRNRPDRNRPNRNDPDRDRDGPDRDHTTAPDAVVPRSHARPAGRVDAFRKPEVATTPAVVHEEAVAPHVETIPPVVAEPALLEPAAAAAALGEPVLADVFVEMVPEPAVAEAAPAAELAPADLALPIDVAFESFDAPVTQPVAAIEDTSASRPQDEPRDRGRVGARARAAACRRCACRVRIARTNRCRRRRDRGFVRRLEVEAQAVASPQQATPGGGDARRGGADSGNRGSCCSCVAAHGRFAAGDRRGGARAVARAGRRRGPEPRGAARAARGCAAEPRHEQQRDRGAQVVLRVRCEPGRRRGAGVGARHGQRRCCHGGRGSDLQGIGAVEFQSGSRASLHRSKPLRVRRGRCSTTRRRAMRSRTTRPRRQSRRPTSCRSRRRLRVRSPSRRSRWPRPRRQGVAPVASHRLGPHACRLAGARPARRCRLCRRVVVRHADRARLADRPHASRPASRSRSTACRAGRRPFALSLKPGRHTIELRQGTATRVIPVEISAGVQTEQRITWGKAFKSGQARITSTPEGARVLIDGKSHGKTPVMVSELSAGKHAVTVEASTGSVTSSLIIEPGETTELDVPVYSGWVSVLSPVELEIFERGRLIGTTEAEKIMLAPGRHKLELKNESLGYEGTQSVEVRPGATTAVSVLPKAEVTVEGPKGTELFIDGERVGELPIDKLKTPIGTREFLFKHPEQGERRQVVVVTMTTPVTVKY